MSSYLYNHHNTCWLLFCHKEKNILFIRKREVYFAYTISLEQYSVHFFQTNSTLIYIICWHAHKKLYYSLRFYVGYLNVFKLTWGFQEHINKQVIALKSTTQLLEWGNNPWWRLYLFDVKISIYMFPNDTKWCKCGFQNWNMVMDWYRTDRVYWVKTSTVKTVQLSIWG